MHPGDDDIKAAIDELASGLPEPLRPLARIAHNYRWSWEPDGPPTFAAIDPDRWTRAGANPKRLLRETPRSTLARAAADAGYVARVHALDTKLRDELARPGAVEGFDPAYPVAFMCAEFGVHGSLPIYSGGLGALAGDLLKEASDLGLPMVGVGLLYRTGYFHQRIDTSGYQHEYWIDTDPDLLPCVRVTGADGTLLRVRVPVDGESVLAQVWRVDVGRVPLYLLDTDLPENSPVGRWVTSRLYEGNRAIRLAQYAVLGVGGVRALAAMGIDPAVYHLNEGHPALGVFDLVRREMTAGTSLDDARAAVREKVVFTTHTPVPAGNETYERGEILAMLSDIGDLVGDRERFLALGRMHPDDPGEPSGMTPLAIRSARSTNGVSRRHGGVAREMWRPMFPGHSTDDVPITHVTNGVHVATWVGAPMRALFDRYFGTGWLDRADDPATWAVVDDIPDHELWAARTAARAELVDLLHERVTGDRLRRGEDLSYSEAGGLGFAADRLTVGFARRLATYKRLYLVSLLPDRSLPLLEGERAIQFVFAGKAHPLDEQAKRIVQDVFRLKGAPQVAGRVAFLEDYDLTLASQLVSGCDVWVNLPRPPQEASGTSGMKSCMNGGLQMSVLDGWWAEAYDGANGWAIDGGVDPDEAAQDWRHATEQFDLWDQRVVPLFNDRDADGIPRGWLAMVRASLKTNGPRFSATRMVREYAARIYRPPATR
jgi:starch phosphorylase